MPSQKVFKGHDHSGNCLEKLFLSSYTEISVQQKQRVTAVEITAFKKTNSKANVISSIDMWIVLQEC